ncbi:MAG: c-type cytochrome domain-containing protein, partial [Planctomycetaceae bacterium]
MKNGEAENFVTRRHGGMAALLVAFLQFVCSQSIAAVEDDLYLAQIRPLLHERCTACHGSLKQEAGLRLDTGILIRQGGDSGPAVVPRQPEESLLLQRVTCAEEDGRMPPLGMALTVADLSHLRDWIQAGATSPQFEEPEASPLEHWAFVPPLRHELPQVSEPEWCRNPVDRFLM